jgi:hypothetical protein
VPDRGRSAAALCVTLLVLAALAACASVERRDDAGAVLTLPRPVGGSPDQPPTSAIVPGSAYLGARNRCIDRELSSRGLNEFGDPPGTTYPGGSPLYDAITGSVADRYDYVLQHRRDIGVNCTRAPGEPRP